MTRVLPEGSYWISAGWRYSSGSLHAAYDLACPLGTPVRSGVYGTVAATADGAHNNRPGEAIWSGKRSNWVLIYSTMNGKKVSSYYQHLSPGVKVSRGQKVKPGTLLGYSGNSGNSSGPHLHYHAYYGHSLSRYNNMTNNGQYAVYPPTKIEIVGGDEVTNEDINKVANAVVAKLKASEFEDGAFDKNSKYRKVSFKNLMSRIANRSHNANVNSKRVLDQAE